MSIKDQFPPPDDALALEPEELALFLLKYLYKEEQTGNSSVLNLHNCTLHGNLQDYAGEKYDEISRAITEAWIWLEREGMIAPKPAHERQWVYVTNRGKRLLESSDIGTYLRSNILPVKVLDPVLAGKVRPLFIRGDYDTAVFQAFKEVEIRVRKAASLPKALVGVDLMRSAFHPDNGKLTDMSRIKAEREATSHLFAGAIGLFKNPSSHRDVNWQDPGECAELIYLANHLLRLIEKHYVSTQGNSNLPE
jgi:uncharacterized protein (TIGR02391 family)